MVDVKTILTRNFDSFKVVKNTDTHPDAIPLILEYYRDENEDLVKEQQRLLDQEYPIEPTKLPFTVVLK